MNINWRVCMAMGAFMVGSVVCPTGAFANNLTDIQYRYHIPAQHQFMVTPPRDTSLPPLMAVPSKSDKPSGKKTQNKQSKKDTKKKGQQYANALLDKIPYGDNLVQTWNIVDGDVDILIEGLRADRRNKGLEYTSSTLPMLGEMEGFEWKIEAGDTHKLSFKSNVTPFIGKVEGLSFKGSASEDNSKISARYTIKFD